MTLRFWDMDHTLVDGDTDVFWKRFLVERGIAPADSLKEMALHEAAYEAGELDFDAFLDFQLREMRGRTLEELRALATECFEHFIRPRILPATCALLEEQLACGERPVLLTATSRVLAEPLARELGVARLEATELEQVGGRATGRMRGEFCFGPAKAERLRQVCREEGVSLSDAWLYGDGRSDIEALQLVGHPVVVGSWAPLRELARERGWPLIDPHG
jgi:HAD superfamily hydrolase (TIGR01490 family)